MRIIMNGALLTSDSRSFSCNIYIIRIKNDFPFINIHRVPREVLKTSFGTLRMLMNDKIMFDHY